MVNRIHTLPNTKKGNKSKRKTSEYHTISNVYPKECRSQGLRLGQRVNWDRHAVAPLGWAVISPEQDFAVLID